MMRFYAPRLFKLYDYYHSIDQLISRLPRPFTVFLKSYLENKSVVGVEIGVQRGDNARNLFEMLNIKHLFLIDPYESYFDVGRMRGKRAKQYSEEMRSQLNPFWDRITLIRDFSENAIHKIPIVDFVYIDGNHTYKFVKSDLDLYYPKTRIALAGHDFHFKCEGIQRAVTEFARARDLPLYIEIPDFWFIRPQLLS